MKRWRTYHRKKRRSLSWEPPLWYWKALIEIARERVAQQEKDSWPPKYEDFFKDPWSLGEGFSAVSKPATGTFSVNGSKPILYGDPLLERRYLWTDKKR
jgi:hypothetical protein